MTAQADTRRRLLAHYEQDGLLERIDTGLSALGEDPAKPSLDSLSPVDEFHIRGRAATLDLIELMEVSEGDRVLDVGSGLGGSARQLAAATGAKVTGVDISAEYCAVAETLSARIGLGGRTRFFASDVSNLDSQEESFDAAWSIYVGMNVANKESFDASIIKRLARGSDSGLSSRSSNWPGRCGQSPTGSTTTRFTLCAPRYRGETGCRT